MYTATGKHLGTFGCIGSFSFSTPKIITTGQGGALVTNSTELYQKIKRIKDFGRETPGKDIYLATGWNFKFTDLQAVIGIEQMKKLPARVDRKKEMFEIYAEQLSDIDEIELIPTNLENTAPWFMDCFVQNRADLIPYLKERNIGAREFYPALHSCPAYNLPGHFPVTEEISASGLWLPSSIKITNEEIKIICQEIRNFYG